MNAAGSLLISGALFVALITNPGWAQDAGSDDPVPSAAVVKSPFQLLTLEADALALTAQRIKAGDSRVMPAFEALQRRADKALKTPLRSVTHKSLMPPSGSKNDYMSMGPYWWPNPKTANGLPYIQRDGQRNPEAMGEALDSIRLQNMLADTRDLSLAFHFTGDGRYAAKAREVIRTWFLDPATRMNPHLRFGQSIPGVAEGRGIGIIDTRDMWLLMDALALLGPSQPDGTGLTLVEQQGVHQWFVDYAEWMDTSKLGRDEAAAKNNHGMFFDVQQVGYWLFTGQTERARQMVFKAQTHRLGAQIDTRGLMPLELARTRPYHYHTFTLEAVTRLARFGQVLAAKPLADSTWPASDPRCRQPELNIGCPLDLWNLVIDGRSVRAVLDQVAAVVLDPKSWTHTTALEPNPPIATALPVLLMAQRAYPPGTYAAALDVLRGLSPEHVSWLLWPTP